MSLVCTLSTSSIFFFSSNLIVMIDFLSLSVSVTISWTPSSLSFLSGTAFLYFLSLSEFLCIFIPWPPWVFYQGCLHSLTILPRLPQGESLGCSTYWFYRFFRVKSLSSFTWMITFPCIDSNALCYHKSLSRQEYKTQNNRRICIGTVVTVSHSMVRYGQKQYTLNYLILSWEKVKVESI